MTALLDLDANVALSHALALVEEATAALAEIPLDAVMGVGLGEQILRLRGAQRQLEATSSALTHRFASSSEWELDGARSATRWLYGHGNEAWSEARLVVTRGALLTDFPCVSAAWRKGEISAQHVDALDRLRRHYPALRESLVAVDEAIAEAARRCEPREFYQRLRHLCHRIDPDAIDDRERERTTGLHVSLLLDGLVRVDGTLDAVLGARFLAALESARRDVPEESEGDASGSEGTQPGAARDPRALSRRNLDALGRILDAAGAATGDAALPLVSGERPTINVTVPVEALIDETSVEVGWLERFGIPTTLISGDHARRLACDASLRPLLVDRQGRLVAMLPKVRAIHPALRRAVFMRDRQCRFPACRARIDEVHHIVFHSRGGPTVLSNLVGLCWHHHHLIHDGGWLIEGDPGGELQFSSRHSRQMSDVPF